MSKLTQKFRTILADKAGTGALELAMALPMLMLLMVGMIDISRLVAARIDAEQAAQRATDFALAIRPTSGSGSYIAAEAAKIDDVGAEDVSVDIFLECNGQRMTSFGSACGAGQDSARFVSVEVDRDVDFLFDWGAFAALFGSRVMGNGAVVQGDSIVRFQ